MTWVIYDMGVRVCLCMCVYVCMWVCVHMPNVFSTDDARNFRRYPRNILERSNSIAQKQFYLLCSISIHLRNNHIVIHSFIHSFVHSCMHTKCFCCTWKHHYRSNRHCRRQRRHIPVHAGMLWGETIRQCKIGDQEWWHMSTIPGKLRQEDSEFKASLSKQCLRK